MRRCEPLPGHTNFNPRPREGGDNSAYSGTGNVEISIHAPVKGATRACDENVMPPVHFNPRPREGGDVRPCKAYFGRSVFQSTPP